MPYDNNPMYDTLVILITLAIFTLLVVRSVRRSRTTTPPATPMVEAPLPVDYLDMEEHVDYFDDGLDIMRDDDIQCPKHKTIYPMYAFCPPCEDEVNTIPEWDDLPF